MGACIHPLKIASEQASPACVCVRMRVCVIACIATCVQSCKQSVCNRVIHASNQASVGVVSVGRTCVMVLTLTAITGYVEPFRAPPHRLRSYSNLPQLEFFTLSIVERI